MKKIYTDKFDSTMATVDKASKAILGKSCTVAFGGVHVAIIGPDENSVEQAFNKITGGDVEIDLDRLQDVAIFSETKITSK